MKVQLDTIRQLADLAIEKGLAELTVSEGDQSVTLKMPSSYQQVSVGAPQVFYGSSLEPAAPQATATPVDITPGIPPQAAAPAAADDARYYTVTSPMVGTFYQSPSPDSPPFVSEGQTVSVGQTLCIIEAMKLMNELESEVGGRVVKMLVQNAQPVEFGQPLMLVDPS